jgi:hypothetical protein
MKGIRAKPISGLRDAIEGCVSWRDIQRRLRDLTDKQKGDLFEALVKAYLLPIDGTHRNPLLVNKDVPESHRRVPFRNIIYIGDGLTDIPCFSLVKKNGGTTFGVFQPEQEHSVKRALLEFLKTDRVVSCHAPRYRKSDELGSLLRAAVLQRCQAIEFERQGAVDV